MNGLSSKEGDGVVLMGLFLDFERLLFLLEVLFLPGVVLLFAPLELGVLLSLGEGINRKLLKQVNLKKNKIFKKFQ